MAKVGGSKQTSILKFRDPFNGAMDKHGEREREVNALQGSQSFNLMLPEPMHMYSRGQNVFSHCSVVEGAQHWQCQSGTSSGNKYKLAYIRETRATRFSLFVLIKY